MASHPYLGRPDYCFWRRAVAELPVQEVDPVVSAKFRVTKSDKVVTAGSCFAQHIARHLKASGFNFYITETPHPFTSDWSHQRFGYGQFSARYGNVYTSRQLLQLLQRTHGSFNPKEDYWLEKDGRVLDPFRPTIQPSGFANKLEFDRDRDQHFAAVRRAIKDMDVFVFTLGLTETWLSIDDGAAYPICPGVSGGVFNAGRYRFENLSVREVISDLEQSLDFIKRYNEKAKIIFTVSPVPLVATMEDQSVLTATTHSKSVLRVAADEIAKTHKNVAYFPSYEIIAGTFSRGKYFADDLRKVTEEGVGHVMSLFMRHYASEETASSIKSPRNHKDRDKTFDVTEAIVKTMCDEEALDVVAYEQDRQTQPI
jgi:hypothetical protein